MLVSYDFRGYVSPCIFCSATSCRDRKEIISEKESESVKESWYDCSAPKYYPPKTIEKILLQIKKEHPVIAAVVDKAIEGLFDDILLQEIYELIVKRLSEKFDVQKDGILDNYYVITTKNGSRYGIQFDPNTLDVNTIWISLFERLSEKRGDGKEVIEALMEVNFELFGKRCIRACDAGVSYYERYFKLCNQDYQYPYICKEKTLK